ncbi:MAG TPA: hypothetical protein VK453_08400 [Micromonosporaceae bacterium]|nr:hypothetical protein [Micromonosporaceae bacterium]
MRRPVQFEPASPAGGTAVTKLGGQPVWLQAPQWPLSTALAEPMMFIGQFRLDADDAVRMAYVFMSDDDDGGVDGTWEPEGGENAVIIQPDGRLPPFVTVRSLHEGPSWPAEDHLPVDDRTAGDDDAWEFLDGEPVWLQGDESPGPGWRLVGQLTDRLGYNFGDAGIGYIFVSPDGHEGRFLWQCA